MKKTAAVVLLSILAITGCSTTVQPTFDPSKTEVKTIDGKKFNIPKGAVASPHIESDRVIMYYIKSGLDSCSSGDVTWVEISSQEEINQAIRNGDKTIHSKLAKEGKIGCASPLK